MPRIAQDFDRIGKPRKAGIKQKYILDESGRRLLLAKYDGRTETIDDLARLLHVPRWRVKNWASEFGLARQKEPRWTEDELLYLERSIARKSTATMAKYLGRTKSAVKNRIKKLSLTKKEDGYTLKDLCMGLGCDHKSVYKWVDLKWLKGRRRHTEHPRDMWIFTDTDLRNFIAAHPLEIDPRRADWLWLVDVLMSGSTGQNGLGVLALPDKDKEQP